MWTPIQASRHRCNLSHPLSLSCSLLLTHFCSYSESKDHPHPEVLTSPSRTKRQTTFYPYLALLFPETSLIVSLNDLLFLEEGSGNTSLFGSPGRSSLALEQSHFKRTLGYKQL